MPSLFMICSESHDIYTNHFTITAEDSEDAFCIAKEEGFEYGMLGYLCLQKLDGPVHPDSFDGIGKTCFPEPYHQPTIGDLLK